MEYLNNLLNSNTQSGGVYAVSMHQLNQTLQLSSAYFNRFDENTKQQYIKLFGFTPLSLLKGHNSSKMPQYRERFIFLIYLQFIVLLMMNKTSGMNENETLKYLSKLCVKFNVDSNNSICSKIKNSLSEISSPPPSGRNPPSRRPPSQQQNQQQQQQNQQQQNQSNQQQQNQSNQQQQNQSNQQQQQQQSNQQQQNQQQQAEREQAEREAKEQAEREQAEREAKEQAEREQAEREAKEQAEREAKEQAEREQAEREQQEEDERQRKQQEEDERQRKQQEEEQAKEQERLEQERLEQEKLEQERLKEEEAQRKVEEEEQDKDKIDKINCENITKFKQNQNDCWLDTFFVVISADRFNNLFKEFLNKLLEENNKESKELLKSIINYIEYKKETDKANLKKDFVEKFVNYYNTKFPNDKISSDYIMPNDGNGSGDISPVIQLINNLCDDVRLYDEDNQNVDSTYYIQLIELGAGKINDIKHNDYVLNAIYYPVGSHYIGYYKCENKWYRYNNEDKEIQIEQTKDEINNLDIKAQSYLFFIKKPPIPIVPKLSPPPPPPPKKPSSTPSPTPNKLDDELFIMELNEFLEEYNKLSQKQGGGNYSREDLILNLIKGVKYAPTLNKLKKYKINYNIFTYNNKDYISIINSDNYKDEDNFWKFLEKKINEEKQPPLTLDKLDTELFVMELNEFCNKYKEIILKQTGGRKPLIFDFNKSIKYKQTLKKLTKYEINYNIFTYNNKDYISIINSDNYKDEDNFWKFLGDKFNEEKEEKAKEKAKEEDDKKKAKEEDATKYYNTELLEKVKANSTSSSSSSSDDAEWDEDKQPNINVNQTKNVNETKITNQDFELQENDIERYTITEFEDKYMKLLKNKFDDENVNIKGGKRDKENMQNRFLSYLNNNRKRDKDNKIDLQFEFLKHNDEVYIFIKKTDNYNNISEFWDYVEKNLEKDEEFYTKITKERVKNTNTKKQGNTNFVLSDEIKKRRTDNSDSDSDTNSESDIEGGGSYNNINITNTLQDIF